MQERVRCPASNKDSYRTPAKARVYAARHAKRFGKQLYQYKCPHCGLWHLTKIRQ